MIRNTKSTLIEATLLVVAVAATATYLWRHYDRSAQPEVPAVASTKVDQSAVDNPFASSSVSAHSSAAQQERDPNLAALNAQMAALAAQIASLKRQASSATASQDPAPTLTREEEQQRGDAQADAQEKLVEQTIVSERLDPTWAPAAESAIRKMFDDSQIESLKLVGTQCRATLCRIDLASNGPAGEGGDFDQSFRKLLVRMPWQAQGFGRVYDPFGPSPTAVFFLAREGSSLPQPST
jgi:molecular chaperone GrpE (heat shock protein)